jgi:hypothetical protein
MTSRHVAIALPLVCAACTFTGLGNYPITACGTPVGQTTHVADVSMLAQNPDFSFSSASGANAIGAFVANANQGECVQGVDTVGYIGTNCSFFGTIASGVTLGTTIAVRQPWAVTMTGGDAVVAVATSAPCTQGLISFEYDGQDVVADGSQACDSLGASLPSFVASTATTGTAAWYQTAISTRTDPIQSCASAVAAPLLAATVTLGTTSATIGAPVTLSTQSTSIRPPSTLLVNGHVVVAAPNANDVAVWSLDGSASVGSPVTIPGLAEARAVSIATDTNGENFAVVAEIGCSPQSIVLAVGSLTGGFSKITTIAPMGSGPAVQPTVAWVDADNAWIVSWVASPPAHVLAMRLDATGDPQGGVIDPGVAGDGSAATADGRVLAYLPTTSSFETADLGCGD